jgi:hypothetical protein
MLKKLTRALDPARVATMVQEMREIFAEFGVGFATALLRECNWSYEQAINR